MGNRIYDENNGLWYAKQGDYYLPELALPLEEEKLIGIWEQRYLWYLKENKQLIYLNLLTSGRLNEYLTSVDEQAEDMFFRLVKQYADRQGVTEQLKVENQLLWVQKMNNIRACVREVVEREIIYL
ncbi:hypothetical protein C807_03066 [Lachnospiraceae bacterium 28-4]|nr:hypothetical protein C807_03066 [Lachnospiraceae bacterium 28-4]